MKRRLLVLTAVKHGLAATSRPNEKVLHEAKPSLIRPVGSRKNLGVQWCLLGSKLIKARGSHVNGTGLNGSGRHGGHCWGGWEKKGRVNKESEVKKERKKKKRQRKKKADKEKRKQTKKEEEEERRKTRREKQGEGKKKASEPRVLK